MSSGIAVLPIYAWIVGVIEVPAVREKVHFDVGAPRPPIRPKRKVYSLQHVDYKLVTHFVIPQLYLNRKQTHRNLMLHLHFNTPTALHLKCTHLLRVALALNVEHLGAFRDWRETGHLGMVSPSSVTQKNWNLLWRQKRGQKNWKPPKWECQHTT